MKYAIEILRAQIVHLRYNMDVAKENEDYNTPFLDFDFGLALHEIAELEKAIKILEEVKC